jgi:uncharacterized repeat protein (TIGR01451 family)
VSLDNSEKITISEPYIEITKTIDKQQLNLGDELTAKVTTKNAGNVDASVTVTDTMPSEAKLTSGEISFKQVLASESGSKTIIRILPMNKEEKSGFLLKSGSPKWAKKGINLIDTFLSIHYQFYHFKKNNKSQPAGKSRD